MRWSVTVAEPSGRERIEHIVVLILEKRSFDHVLGTSHSRVGARRLMVFGQGWLTTCVGPRSAMPDV
jgi:phospholipase C